MRVLKNKIYKSVLEAARKEFMDKGYKDASMRNIARKADVGVSNIYNYFRNKDEIFLAIVLPAKESLFSFIAEQHSEKNTDFHIISTLHYQEDAIERYIGLLDKYKEEIRLLLYHSEGSSMKNFRNTFTEHLTRVSHGHMALLKKYYPHTGEISAFFIHNLCAFMVSIIGEIITHNLSRQKIREFFSEYFRFEIAGWQELIRV